MVDYSSVDWNALRLKLLRILPTYADHNDKEDAVQLAIIKIHKLLAEGYYISNLDSFAGTTANRQLIDIYKSRKYHLSLDYISCLEDDSMADPAWLEDTTDYAGLVLKKLEVKDILRHAENIPTELKTPLLLYASGKSYNEIQAIIDIPLGTIRSRVWRARQYLNNNIAGIPNPTYFTNECRNGHEMTPENTLIGRKCKECCRLSRIRCKNRTDLTEAPV